MFYTHTCKTPICKYVSKELKLLQELKGNQEFLTVKCTRVISIINCGLGYTNSVKPQSVCSRLESTIRLYDTNLRLSHPVNLQHHLGKTSHTRLHRACANAHVYNKCLKPLNPPRFPNTEKGCSYLAAF